MEIESLEMIFEVISYAWAKFQLKITKIKLFPVSTCLPKEKPQEVSLGQIF